MLASNTNEDSLEPKCIMTPRKWISRTKFRNIEFTTFRIEDEEIKFCLKVIPEAYTMTWEHHEQTHDIFGMIRYTKFKILQKNGGYVEWRDITWECEVLRLVDI